MPPDLPLQGRLLGRNAVLNLLGQGLPLIVAVITLPFVVQGLGAERFGILSLTWVVLGYFSMFDLGLGQAATKFVAEAIGKGDSSRVPSIVWTASIAQAVLGTIGGLILAAITPLVVGGLLSVPQELIGEATASFYLLAIALPVLLVSSSLRGLLEAAQRFDLVNAVRIPSNAALYLVPFAGVAFGWSLPGIIALLVMTRGCATVAQYWLCARLLAPSRARPQLQLSELRTLLGFGAWVTVSSVVAPVLVYLDRFVIAILVSVAAVGYYSAPYEVITRLWIIPVSLLATLFPAFSALNAQAEHERLAAMARRSMKYLLLSLGPIAVLVIAYAPQILWAWLGPEFARESALVLQILVVGVFVNSLARVPFTALQAVGRPDVTAKLHLAELPFYALILLVCVVTWGTAGAALAWTLRAMLDALLLFSAAHRFASLSPRGLLPEKVPAAVSAAGLLGVATLGIKALVIDPWLHITLLALVSASVGVLVWRSIFSEHDRAQVRQVLGLGAVE